jgi:hypothetical protein
MAAHRTLSWLQAEKMAKKPVRIQTKLEAESHTEFFQHLPASTATNKHPSAATSPADSIEFVPASVSVPTDTNIGGPTRLSKTVSSVLHGLSEAAPSEVQTCHPRQSISSPSASSEILKIDDLNIYKAACAEYSRGLAAEWTEERLLAMVTSWRILDQEEKDK